jgi:hypothetical protein
MEQDWGQCSVIFDDLKVTIKDRDILIDSEAQTRFDIIDRIIKDILGWSHGQITVEPRTNANNRHYIDYLLRCGDNTILIEAKRSGAAFPSPTKKPQLKITGSVLGEGEIGDAITQAIGYAKETTDSMKAAVDVVIVTNGLCWCFFSFKTLDENSYANLLFPFESTQQAEELFNNFSVWKVEKGSLGAIKNTIPIPENRIIGALKHLDGRFDRNNIADHILPALDHALYADAILKNKENLEKCFVSTDNRTKYDSQLKIYLSDSKPILSDSLKRVRKDRSQNEFARIVENGLGTFSPPVVLLIGPVGVGKSTFLVHFQHITGAKLIKDNKIHWIYVDFEKLGSGGNPRQYLYGHLRDYLLSPHPGNETDFTEVVELAYSEIIEGLRRGPLSMISNDKVEFSKRVTDIIQAEYINIEPYVDRVYKYLTTKSKCVIVLDNIDLYEDTALEASVFGEGLALSRKINANIIVSIRDRTFVKHRSDSTFDAYELRALWLDPPPFKEVLSRRLTYSKKILKGKSASLLLPNSATLTIPDVSNFFDIVQHSVLAGPAGSFVDCMADLNIRKGLTMITNFLTSGHIQADNAIRNYMAGDAGYTFPFHEIFKGTMLSQWKHFKEDRSVCINLFDSRLGAKNLKLLRLYLLVYLNECASHQHTIEVQIKTCFEILGDIGCTENHITLVMNSLYKNGLIRNISATDIDIDSTVALTRCGGYYISIMITKFVYVEECMHDTAIDDDTSWREINHITKAIEAAIYIADRMSLRINRMNLFLDYLKTIETSLLSTDRLKTLAIMDRIIENIKKNMQDVSLKIDRYYSNKLIQDKY